MEAAHADQRSADGTARMRRAGWWSVRILTIGLALLVLAEVAWGLLSCLGAAAG